MPAVVTDTVASAIAKALNAAVKAHDEANADTRTNGTLCTDYLTTAVASLKGAQLWIRELHAEEARDARTKPTRGL